MKSNFERMSIMVNNYALNEIIKRGIWKADRFMKPATYMFNKAMDGEKAIGNLPITEQNALKELIGVSMSIGSELTKHKYTTLGLIIGVTGTVAVLKLKEKRKSKKA
jgi:hypothetical protein